MRDSVPGAASLGKALSLLEHLARAGPSSLSQLVQASGLPRATTHRLAAALLSYRLVDKTAGGTYRLGPRLVELGALAAHSRPGLAEAAAPALARLRDRTGESTQLFVAEAGRRTCIVSLQSPHSLRTIVPVGAALPMDKGSAGKALRLARAKTGRPLDAAWTESVEEREIGVASVSAPVFLDGSVVAAVSVSGPVERTGRSPGARYGQLVAEAAKQISDAIA